MAFVVHVPVQKFSQSSITVPRHEIACSQRPPTSTDPKLSALATWLASSKADMTSLSPSTGVVSGRGMVTDLARVTGDYLARVPTSLALQDTSLDPKRSPFPKLVSSEAWSKQPWYGRLALRLLAARNDVEDNRRQYFRALPTSFSTPLHWEDSELDELQSSRMVQSIRVQRKRYEKLYDDANVEAWVSRKEWAWAVQCIRSRAFAGELETAPFAERLRLFAFAGALATVSSATGIIEPASALNGALTATFALIMYDILVPRVLGVMSGVKLKRYSVVPGIDFINHSSSVNGKAEVSYEYFTDNFAVKCGDNYEVGDEVAISYGAQCNDSFLQFYGFVEKDNPADTYKFDSEVEEVLGVTKGTLTACRLVGFPAKTIAEVAASFNGDMEAARLTLADLCRAELDGKASTLEEDLALEEPENANLRLALHYRIEKKGVLREALSVMNAS